MSFSFGTPSSAPATTGLTGGFSFGANKPATTGFSLTATTQATGLFGAPATSAPAFGTATGTAPAFGTTPAFGAAAPTFGGNTSFGATSNAPAFGATTSLSFGVSSAAPAFGAAASTFGATATPAFGANTSFGTGGLSFGTGTSTAASTGLSFGTTTTTSTGLGGLGGFGFGASTQSNWSLGSTATTSASAFGNQLGATNVTGIQVSTSAAPSLGLGGVAQSGITNTTTTDGKSEPPMQQKLPNEISTTVESFKEFVKKQKTLSSDIMRISIKPLHKVSQEAETTLRAVAALRGECGRARAHCKRLRAAAAAALAAAETAARDAPGTDLEGPIPPQYVSELISELEQQLTTFRRQMDVADKQMQSSPKLLTEQELTLGIRRMHESLVALAARLQAAHALVAAQKDQYLNLRKYILKDPTDVFDTTAPNASLDQILRDVEGTRKKKSISDIGLGSSVLSDPRAVLGNIQQLAGPTPFTYLGNSMSSLPATDNTGSNWQPQPQTNLNPSLNLSFGTAQNDSGFQLQKPPGKRGKQ